MAEIYRLSLTPGASTYLQGMPTTDGFMRRDLDGTDAGYPFTWQMEGVKYSASVGPAGVPGITLDTLYDDAPDGNWQYGTWAPILVGPLGAVGSPSVAGKWVMNKGRRISVHYIDTTVKDDAAYLLPQVIFSGGLFSGIVQVGMYDWDGTTCRFDVYCGVRAGSDYDTSAAISWASLEGNYVKVDCQWNLSSDGGVTADAWLKVHLYTSTNLTTWADLGEILNEPACKLTSADRVGSTDYGYAPVTGFDGFFGALISDVLFDDDIDDDVVIPPTDEGGDVSEHDCCSAPSVNTATSPNPIGVLPPWNASCIGAGAPDTVSNVAQGESF